MAQPPSSCCDGLPLRTGCYIVAYYDVSTTIVATFLAVCFGFISPRTFEGFGLFDTIMWTLSEYPAPVLVMIAINCVFVVMLFIGMEMKMLAMLVGYQLWTWASMISLAAATVFRMVYHDYMGVISLFVVFQTKLYSFLVVWRYYKLLRLRISEQEADLPQGPRIHPPPFKNHSQSSIFDTLQLPRSLV